MLLMIDNYDSFTYNLVQYFAELGQETVVYRNDEITPEQAHTLSPDYIVIGPGPCSPAEAEGANAIIRAFAGKIPILGVCLGHQCMGYVFGGTVTRAPMVMHGKTSTVFHKGEGVFRDLPNPMQVVRYHSLAVPPQQLPQGFMMTAWSFDDDQQVVMGMRHPSLMMEGVQFHPESFMTECGHQMLGNFLKTFAGNNRKVMA